MRIILKYPTRSRPDLFRQTFARYMEACDPSHVSPIITIDRDDHAMNRQQMLAWIRGMGGVPFVGMSRTKIQAINADIPIGPWDIMVLASDDHLPLDRWDKRVIADMQEQAPNGEPCILWYRDTRQEVLNSGAQICFMPVMNRAAYDHFGYIYHPDYVSLWCDNEQTEVCTANGMMRRIPVELFRNESPDWGGTIKRDQLYRKNNRHFDTDKKTYLRRKAAGFPK